MTEREQQIAIAEFCGWKLSKETDRFGNAYYQKGEDYRRAGEFPRTATPIPDYLNDLNAIHEVVNHFSFHQRENYNAKLFQVVSGVNQSIAITEPNYIFQALNATAAQRCEALLRTIGEWQESAVKARKDGGK